MRQELIKQNDRCLVLILRKPTVTRILEPSESAGFLQRPYLDHYTSPQS